MPIESLYKLESKINELLEELKSLREKKATSKEKTGKNREKISILEKENQKLKKQLSELSRVSGDDRKRIDLAAEKIRDMLGKLANL